MATKESGVKINGSIKLIGFIVLMLGSAISVVTSIEGMRSDIRVNSEVQRVTAEGHNEKIELLREDVKAVGKRIDRVEDDLHEHIEEGK